MYVTCDLLAPPDVIKKYVTKNKEELNENNKKDWCPYYFDLNKVVKKPILKRRIANISWPLRNWGTPENVFNAGYVPGSDSVSFECKTKCPDIAIKKIFSENPKVPIRFYWFNEGDDRTHYYFQDDKGRITVKYGQGILHK